MHQNGLCLCLCCKLWLKNVIVLWLQLFRWNPSDRLNYVPMIENSSMLYYGAESVNNWRLNSSILKELLLYPLIRVNQQAKSRSVKVLKHSYEAPGTIIDYFVAIKAQKRRKSIYLQIADPLSDLSLAFISPYLREMYLFLLNTFCGKRWHFGATV